LDENVDVRLKDGSFGARVNRIEEKKE
jgi:hypothetical protein